MQSHQKTEFHNDGRQQFNRLFPELNSLKVSDDNLVKLANKMFEYSRCNNSKVITNGLSIFGQFLAHDMTFEVTSRFREMKDLSLLQNDRSHNLDLDCMYGQWAQDFLYDKNDRNKLLLGSKCEDEYGNSWYDLQRNAQCKAIIPDARNDENIIVSRMHVLFIEFHNKMVDQVRKECRREDVFKEARRRVIWHYHWLIVHEYLYKMMDWTVFDDIMKNGAKFYKWPGFLPLEFTGAAFRQGHSQTREDNRISEHVNKGLFELGAFETMEYYLDWAYLFDFGDDRVQYAKLIDTNIGKTFHDLPFIPSDNKNFRSLPFRNLKRGIIYGLPSGEDVAKRMCFEPMPVEESRLIGLDATPLWFYILKEAEVLGHGGEHMGPVGSTLLGECFLSILCADDQSYLKVHPKWKPTMGREEGKFDFRDLINFVYPNIS